MTGWFLLRGGPHDGKIVEATYARPAIMAGDPRPPNILDLPAGELVWNPELRWYEPRPEKK